MAVQPAPPRVLMISWEYPPYYSGGGGTACYGITRALLQRGVRVFLLFPWARSVVEPGIGGPIPADLTGYRAGGGYASDLVLQDPAVIDPGGKFDLIHCHDWPTVPAALDLSVRFNVPLIVHIHSLESDRSPGGVNPDRAALEAAGCRRAELVIAVSRYTADKLTAEYGIPPEKIQILYNGFEPVTAAAARGRSPGSRTVLFLGRLTAQKGPGIFVNAARVLTASRRDVVFVIAGTGPMEGELRRQAGERIIFTGFVPREDLPTLFDEADILVIPSLSEPFSIAGLEAMNRGLTVVVTRTAGLTEIAQNVVALERPDAAALAGVLEVLLDTPGELERIGSAAAAETAGLDWNARTGELMILYEELLSKPR